MDWTVEDDMVDGLFCATLTGRRGGHTPFIQAGAETMILAMILLVTTKGKE